MNGAAVRLQVEVDDRGQAVFTAQFTAPEEDAGGASFAAELTTGDGARYALGAVSPPTPVTWREQRLAPLVAHTYKGAGPFTAELRLDGLVVASALVHPARRTPGVRSVEPREDGPALFALAPVSGEPLQRTLRLHARALRPGERLRVDGGAGQVRDLAGEDGHEIVAEMLLSYSKPGQYLVSVELLDGEGFWLETLAQTPLEVAMPQEQPPSEAPGASELRAAELAAMPAEPWLPFRNFKARPGGARAYSQPGGGAVRRYVGAGVWLTARRQTSAGGSTWYQTAGGDWVKGETVVFYNPSDLRGVVLGDSTQPPPPPPPPPPPAKRKGVVTATTLNVRARPGVASNNPPVGVLRSGAEVLIYEEQSAGGEVWYRIGANRWVVAKWVRVVEARSVEDADARAVGLPALPFGWVVPDVLDVRAKSRRGDRQPGHRPVAPL